MSINKKALSEIISYVLLISIGLAISGMVFIWLKDYVKDSNVESCPDEISLMIEHLEYNKIEDSNNVSNLTLTIKNRGLFNIDGYLIRVNDKPGLNQGVWLLSTKNEPLNISKSQTLTFNETDFESLNISKVCYVDVQPFIISKSGNKNIMCKNTASRKVDC